MKNIGKIVTSIYLFLLSSVSVSANGINPPIDGTIVTVLQSIVRFLYWVSFPIAVLMIMVSAFFFVTASGNEAQIKKGKDILLYTAIGLLVIIMASGIVSFVQQEFWQS